MQNARDWLTVRLRENALARSREPWQREHLQKVTRGLLYQYLDLHTQTGRLLFPFYHMFNTCNIPKYKGSSHLLDIKERDTEEDKVHWEIQQLFHSVPEVSYL